MIAYAKHLKPLFIYNKHLKPLFIYYKQYSTSYTAIKSVLGCCFALVLFLISSFFS